MSRHYILTSDREAVPCTQEQWAEMFGRYEERVVGRTKVGDATVSTAFLGMDHGFSQTGPPILFETLVFGGPKDGDMERCSTWDEAQDQPDRMVLTLMALDDAA